MKDALSAYLQRTGSDVKNFRVFKKRPSSISGKTPSFKAKSDPEYWRHRLFRNTFTVQGERFHVNHWCVKIQHGGTRKTLALRHSHPTKAAAEASRIYQKIITQGWAGISIQGKRINSHSSRFAREQSLGSNVSYWADRLIHRKYTEKFHPNLEREFSVQIQHAGTSHYFPLRSDDRNAAARQAAQIYRVIVDEGWDKANERFPRELSVAFHWVENPLAWTYTTIQTQPKGFQLSSGPMDKPSAGMLNIAIAESDLGIRKALTWCIDQQKGCCVIATFANAAEAFRQIPRLPIHLVMASQNLADQAGTAFLENLKRLNPKVAGLVFSVYEDCDLLFGCSPGGAACYLFRRTAPTRILEPIIEAAGLGPVTEELIATKVRDYFETALSSLPIGGPSHALRNLTQRELEILGWLSKGQSDKEIADLLRISTWTVHGHLKKIFEKLGAHNRTEAVLRYLHK
jgi:two-component system, NarL family, response regulator NreC